MSTATADDEARAGGGGGACGATRDDMPLELAPRHDINLEDFRVRAAPPALYYVPNAVTADEVRARLALPAPQCVFVCVRACFVCGYSLIDVCVCVCVRACDRLLL
jgi:hypothetical protein